MNAEYDALIDEAATTADAEARYALYHKAEKVLMGRLGHLPAARADAIAVVKPNVKGVHLTPFRFLPFTDVSIE